MKKLVQATFNHPFNSTIHKQLIHIAANWKQYGKPGEYNNIYSLYPVWED